MSCQLVSSGSFVACNHESIRARFTARLLNKQESTRFEFSSLAENLLLNSKAVFKACIGKAVKILVIILLYLSASSFQFENCKHPDLAEPAIGPHLVNQTEPE